MECSKGYTLNAASNICEDINECEVDPTGLCSSNEICVNKPGSYECQSKRHDKLAYKPIYWIN